MRVTTENYPAVFEAFLTCSVDSGWISRSEPVPQHFVVPGTHTHLLPDAEEVLKQLSPEQVKLLVTGEEQERNYLVDSLKAQAADTLIDAFWNSYE